MFTRWKNNLYHARRCIEPERTTASARIPNPDCRWFRPTSGSATAAISNFNSTDLQGFAGFNEIFPLFNWYVLETDSNRYKNTGIHVVNDAGGPADGSRRCGQQGSRHAELRTFCHSWRGRNEDFSVPTSLAVPGSVYCANADCTGFSIANGPRQQHGSGRLYRPHRSSVGNHLRLAGLRGSEPVPGVRQEAFRAWRERRNSWPVDLCLDPSV